MLRVAIVEDDLACSDQICAYLEQFQRDYQIPVAKTVYQDGEDVLERFRSQFDIILMDVQMKFVDGISAARQIRGLDEKVIIIFVTSAGQYAIRGYEVGAFDTRTLIDLAGVIMLYAHNMQICKLYINNELRAVESILNNQYKQYQLSQECIDLINFKYHDLKHQINLWQSEAGSQHHRQYLQELEDKIDGYSLQQHTGNGVQDTILTEKELICKQKHIQLTSIVNGGLLAFLPLEDLCAIFGNALDNAIEAVEQIASLEKRLIRVVVHQVHNFAMIQIENYTETKMSTGGGLPDTTKENRSMHGYGLKSIQYITSKHQGVMAVDCKNNWFILKIMLPIG